MDTPKYIEYEGKTFGLSRAGRYVCSFPLAQAVWLKHKGGVIPHGFHVHHIDENPLNNDISNLKLLSPGDHRREHRTSKHFKGKEGIMIQVREYPSYKGCKTKSIIVDDSSLDMVFARVNVLYNELAKNSQAYIIFHKES